jgi:uncharacterized protein
VSASAVSIEHLDSGSIGLIADAHVHPAHGIALSAAVLDAFADVRTIIALGDLGEASGLDALATRAPVLGVFGADDATDDPRLSGRVRLFEIEGMLIGATFDAAKLGVLADNEGSGLSESARDAMERAFGRAVDVLLCAASHKPYTAHAGGLLIVNPGSPTLPAGCSPTVAVLEVSRGFARVRHVVV